MQMRNDAPGEQETLRRINPKLFVVSVNNHTADAQEAAFASNSKRKLKHKLMDAIEALADSKAAARSCYIHAASAKCPAKTGTGTGIAARFREGKYFNKCGSQYKVYRVQSETPYL